LGQTTPFKPGTPVYGSHLGSFAEFISVPASSLQVIPPSLGTLASPSFTISPLLSQYVNAAGIASTLPVSYGALVIRGELQKGETVLIHSAAGGLGLMAVQIAKSFNCKVIGTAGSPTKCEIAKKFGADICINYSQANTTRSSKEWWELVNDATGGKGADVVFDSVGLVDRSLKCLKPLGRLLIVGFAGLDAERMESIKMNRVLLKQVKLIGYVRT
jgi:NADPH2:quinone reductase